jgi:hypothetical protein
MAEIFDIFFELKANASEAIASFGTVNKELAKMEKNGDIASSGMLKMEKATRYAGTALLGIGGAFATVAGVSIKAAIEVQGAQAKLSTAVKDTGISFAAFTPYMNDAVDSMAKLNFTAGDTMTALAQMTAATRNPQTAINMLGVTADLAAFQHETLAQAADTVSRAAMGQARGLSTLGIALGKTIPKGASVAEIMQAIEDRTKGAAKAAAKADPWKQLTVQFGLMEEKLGTALLPAFQKLSTWIIGTGIPALEKIGKWISNNKGLFELLISSLGSIWAVGKITTFLAYLAKITGAFKAIEVAATAAATAEAAAEGGAVAAAVAGVEAPAATGAVAAAAAASAPAIPLLALAYKRKKDADKMTKEIIATTNVEHYVAGKKPSDPGYNAQYEKYYADLAKPTFMKAAPAPVPWWDVYRKAENWIHSGDGTPAPTTSTPAPSGNINSGINISSIIAQNTAKSKKKKTTKTKVPKGANAKVGLITSPNQHLTVEFKSNNSAVITGITHGTSKAK